MWGQEEFKRFIIETGVVGFLNEPNITTEERHWDLDWKKATEDVYGMVQLTDHLLAFMEHHGLRVRCVYGITEQAAKTAPILTVEIAKQDESYGPGSHTILTPNEGYIPRTGRMENLLDGDPVELSKTPVGDTLLLEEATGTGERIIRAIENLAHRAEVNLIGVIGLINFKHPRPDGKTVEQAVEERGIKYFGMSEMPELLRLAYERERPPTKTAKAVEKEFAKYGIEVKLL